MSVYIKNKQVLVASDFDFNYQKITNLAEPTTTTDGVTLGYADDNYLGLDGGTVNGDVTINGNFYVSGVTTTIDVDNLNITDNYLLLNSGESGAGVSLGTAGLEIDRGSLTNYRILFDESDDKLKAGESGSETEVALFDASGNLTITSARLQFTDSNTEIWEDGSGNLTFKDAVSGTYTLADLTGGGGSETLSGLTDVNIDTPTDNQVLRYSGSTWINDDDYWTITSNVLTPTNSNIDLQLNSIEIEADSGEVSIIDMSVTSTPNSGTEESYSFDLDGNVIMKIYSEADGSGSIENTGVVIEGEYQYFGDPSTNGSWRFYINDSDNLVVEKRVSGSWNFSGMFT